MYYTQTAKKSLILQHHESVLPIAVVPCDVSPIEPCLTHDETALEEAVGGKGVVKDDTTELWLHVYLITEFLDFLFKFSNSLGMHVHILGGEIKSIMGNMILIIISYVYLVNNLYLQLLFN
jgi:hypothetical protein